MFVRQRLYGQILGPHAELAGHVLFNGDRPIEVYIVGQVGDAERPVAQNAFDLVPMQGMLWLERIEELIFTHKTFPGDLVRNSSILL